MNFNLLSRIHKSKLVTVQTQLHPDNNNVTTSADAYVQDTNFDSHFLDSSLSTPKCSNTIQTLKILPGIDEYHKKNNFIFFDSMCTLSRPSKSYLQYIEKHTHLSPEATKLDCTAVLTHFSGVECNENTVYTARYKGGKYSPLQRDRVTANSSYRLAYRIGELQKLIPNESIYNIGIDLTFPDFISEIALTDPKKAENIARKSLIRFVKELGKNRRWIRRKDQKLFYSFNIHTWHSHKPNDPNPTHTPTKPHLHVHLNLLNMVINPDLSLIRFNPNIPEKTLKSEWSYAISRSGFIVPDPVLYIHYSNIKNRGKLTHRIKYCGRSPLNDCFNYFKDNDFIESECSPVFNEFLVNYKNPRHTCGGLRLLSKLLPDPEPSDDEICPVCSSKVTYLGKFYPQDIELLKEQEHLSIVRWDPYQRQYYIIESFKDPSTFLDLSELHDIQSYSNSES